MEAYGLSSELIFEELLRECGRGQVAKASLFALPVVKDLDIFRDRVASFLARGEAHVMHEFIFQGTPVKLSIGALSQQSALRLMDIFMPNCFARSR